MHPAVLFAVYSIRMSRPELVRWNGTGAVIMAAFEIFVCFVQAFIFAMLAGLYIKEAIESH